MSEELPSVATTVFGVIVLAGPAVAWWLFQRWVKSKDAAEEERAKADADFKAEVRADLKELLAGQQASAQNIALLQQTVAMQAGQLAALEKRQDAQAVKHLEAVEKQAREFRDELDRMRLDFPAKKRGGR